MCRKRQLRFITIEVLACIVKRMIGIKPLLELRVLESGMYRDILLKCFHENSYRVNLFCKGFISNDFDVVLGNTRISKGLKNKFGLECTPEYSINRGPLVYETKLIERLINRLTFECNLDKEIVERYLDYIDEKAKNTNHGSKLKATFLKRIGFKPNLCK